MRSRAGGWFFAAVVGFVGGACLWGALTEPDGAMTLYGAAAACFAAVAVLAVTVLAPLDRERGARLVRDGEEPALEVRLRPATPLVMTIVGGTGTVLTLLAVVGVGVTDGGLLLVPLALLFAPVLLEGVHALVRGARLTLTADALHYRGWGLDARLAWADVVAVDYREAGKYSRVWVIGRDAAPSWVARRTRLVLPLDPRPDRPEFGVLTSALADPQAFYATLRLLHEVGPGRRSSYIGDDGVALLRREVGARP